MRQAALAHRTGRAPSTVSGYLRDLDQVVLARRNGVIFDAPGLLALESEVDQAQYTVPDQTIQVARRLTFLLGRQTAQGTKLFSATAPNRPATLREMAEAARLSMPSLKRHLERLQSSGRIVRSGRWWVVPALLSPTLTSGQADPNVSVRLTRAVDRLRAATGSLSEIAAELEEIQHAAAEPQVATLLHSTDLLFAHAAELLDALGVEPSPPGRPALPSAVPS